MAFEQGGIFIVPHLRGLFSHRTPKETGNGNSKNSQNIWNCSQKYCTYWVKWEIILNKLRTRTISCRFWCESALATHMHPTRAKPVLGPKCIIPYGTIQLVPKTSLALVMQTSPLGCRYRCSTDCCIIFTIFYIWCISTILSVVYGPVYSAFWQHSSIVGRHKSSIY